MDRWREQWAFYRWNEARIRRTCFTRRQPRFVVVMLGRALWEPPSYVRFVQIPQPNGNVQFSSSQFRLDVYAYDLEIFTKCMLGNCINSDLLRFMCRVTVCRTRSAMTWRQTKFKGLKFSWFLVSCFDPCEWGVCASHDGEIHKSTLRNSRILSIHSI